jgi:hypothetical protein
MVEEVLISERIVKPTFQHPSDMAQNLNYLAKLRIIKNFNERAYIYPKLFDVPCNCEILFNFVRLQN